jgi:hypothetical protein
MKFINRPVRFLSLLCGLAACLAAGIGDAWGQAEPVAVTARKVLLEKEIYGDAAPPRSPTHALRLTVAYFPQAGWSVEMAAAAASTAAGILGQCGVVITRLEINRLEGDRRFQFFHTPVSRELARILRLPRPTIYFVADTLQQPAFDAEAIGRGNSKTRPELADTVWITRGARDLDIVFAHELVHVLMDSGEHVEEPGNLMRAETSPENTRLNDSQCARLRETASRNGLMQLLNMK